MHLWRYNSRFFETVICTEGKFQVLFTITALSHPVNTANVFLPILVTILTGFHCINRKEFTAPKHML